MPGSGESLGTYIDRKTSEAVHSHAQRKAFMQTAIGSGNNQWSSGITTDGKNVTVPTGDVYSMAPAGSPGPVDATVKIGSKALMLGPHIRCPIITGGSKGFVISAQTQGSAVGVSGVLTHLTQTAWPVFTLFNVTDAANYWEIPTTSLGVFSAYTNPDVASVSTGHDGWFYPSLSPDCKNIALIRLNPKVEQNASPGQPFPAIDMSWTVLKNIGRDNVAHQVTYQSKVEGSSTLAFPGPVAGGSDQEYGFYISPFMHWDSSGNFDFDVWGWCSSDSISGGVITGGVVLNVYGTGMTGTTSLTTFSNAAGVFMNQFPFFSSVSHDAFYSGFDSVPPGRIITSGGTTGRGTAFNNGAGGNSNTIIASSSFPFDSSFELMRPYGSGTGIINPTVDMLLDSANIYPIDPLWSDIYNRTPFSSQIKTTSDGNFISYRETAGGAITLTKYSWDAVHSKAVKGFEMVGNPITIGSLPSTLGTILDWALSSS